MWVIAVIAVRCVYTCRAVWIVGTVGRMSSIWTALPPYHLLFGVYLLDSNNARQPQCRIRGKLLPWYTCAQSVVIFYHGTQGSRLQRRYVEITANCEEHTQQLLYSSCLQDARKT